MPTSSFEKEIVMTNDEINNIAIVIEKQENENIICDRVDIKGMIDRGKDLLKQI